MEKDNYLLPGIEAVDDEEKEYSLPIGKAEIRKAIETLKKYKQGKETLENRIKDNEDWYRLRYYANNRTPVEGALDPAPTSAWLFNALANKHADAMDNYPKPNVLPRVQDDEMDAKQLADIIPVILERNGYEQTYSDMWWYKLKSGTGVISVMWDNDKENGLGDISINTVELFNLYWEPGIKDIQDSTNVFHAELQNAEAVYEAYPDLKEEIKSSQANDIAQYRLDDKLDTSDKLMVVDWYYKKKQGTRTILHYCKYVNDVVLFATENDPEFAERGIYDHGKYPFILDTLFPEPMSPVGFGYVDVCKSPQLYIDKLDECMLRYALTTTRPRYFTKDAAQINMEEFNDLTKDLVHWSGSGDPTDSIMPMQMPNMGNAAVELRTMKVDELKETSGNRDFSQGGTSAGVTAASAIAALQEAGNKLSRDMLKSAYRKFADMCYMVIDLMRQFYTEPRFFRVMDERGKANYIAFNAARLAERQQGIEFGQDLGYRMPVFDIKVSAQKASVFSTELQNERAKELYQLGFFNPQNADQSLAALDMMQFDGIEKVRDTVAQNGTLLQMLMGLQQTTMQLAQIVDAENGSTIAEGIAQSMTGGMTPQIPVGRAKEETETDALGNAFNNAKGSLAGEARKKAANSANPTK